MVRAKADAELLFMTKAGFNRLGEEAPAIAARMMLGIVAELS